MCWIGERPEVEEPGELGLDGDVREASEVQPQSAQASIRQQRLQAVLDIKKPPEGIWMREVGHGAGLGKVGWLGANCFDGADSGFNKRFPAACPSVQPVYALIRTRDGVESEYA